MNCKNSWKKRGSKRKNTSNNSKSSKTKNNISRTIAKKRKEILKTNKAKTETKISQKTILMSKMLIISLDLAETTWVVIE
jgi:hypothetical protein